MKPTTHSTSYPFISPSRFTQSLHGKIAVITGASRGIGRCAAFAFAAAGASVVCIAREADTLSEVVSSIRSRLKVPAIAIAIDITNPSAPIRIIQETLIVLGGPIDILVNNAGAIRYNTFEAEESFADWWAIFELNYRAPLSFIHAVLPSMLARGTGTIISVGSTAGVEASPFCTAYSTGKGALVKFHNELEAEISGRGVSSFVLHPGEVDTGMARVPGAVNLDTLAKTGKMATYLQQWSRVEMQEVDLAANTMVALCAIPGVEVLSGLFVDARRDLEEVIEEAK
ncbi:hypothetical protein MMC31_002385, partial [Peltigera leucophlebia]|nr:hypothetical protein [Peltigera leucophlebia]